MRRLFLAAILGLTACASAPRAAPAGQVAAGPPSITQAPTISLPHPPPKDACGAGELQWLVGRDKSQIPVPTHPGQRRVACTTCPVTMDYRPDRLNILFDAESGVVKEVKCG